MPAIRNAVLGLLLTLSACRRGAVAPQAPAFALTVLTAADTAPTELAVTLLDDAQRVTIPLTRCAPNHYTASLPPRRRARHSTSRFPNMCRYGRSSGYRPTAPPTS